MKKLLLVIGFGLVSSSFAMDDAIADAAECGDLSKNVRRTLKLDPPPATPVKQTKNMAETSAPRREIDPESLEEILLFPEEELQQSRIGKWWNSITQKKKDAIELLGLLGVDIGVEAYRYFSSNDLLSMLVGYAVGKQAARVTDRYTCWKKLLSGLVGWTLSSLPYAFLKYDPVTLEIAFMLYIVHAIFDEYAKSTGRANIAISDFRGMPKALQQAIVDKL